MKINCAICKNDCSDCNRFEVKSSKEQLLLIKKKVSSHYVPPDMNALKLLLEQKSENFEELDNEALENLKKEVLREIAILGLDKV